MTTQPTASPAPGVDAMAVINVLRDQLAQANMDLAIQTARANQAEAAVSAMTAQIPIEAPEPA